MNREIKFRAWVNDHWVDWIPTCKTLGAYNASIIDTDGYTFEEDNPFIVEQYTGLKDKNGKEIYEGDIIEVFSTDEYLAPFEGIYRVYFDNMWLSYMAYKVKSHYSGVTEHFEPEMYDCIEVLGNIHENKELLEDKK